jgi:hypothetical protein
MRRRSQVASPSTKFSQCACGVEWRFCGIRATVKMCPTLIVELVAGRCRTPATDRDHQHLKSHSVTFVPNAGDLFEAGRCCASGTA